jgi:hypothetical protein
MPVENAGGIRPSPVRRHRLKFNFRPISLAIADWPPPALLVS